MALIIKSAADRAGDQPGRSAAAFIGGFMSNYVTPLNYSDHCLRDKNITHVKKYNDSLYKVSYLKSCLRGGFESDEEKILSKRECNHYDYKLDQSISRTKAKIYEKAMCNDFNFFVTLTFNPEWFPPEERKSIKTMAGYILNWFRTYNKRKDICGEWPIQYILIPELHKDGGVHFHGLIRGINPIDLYINQYGYLDFRPFSSEFGFMNLSKIRNKNAVSKYILKYITKDIGTVKEIYGHSYYTSKGLAGADLIYCDNYDVSNISWDYTDKNGYTKCKYYSDESFKDELNIQDSF